MRKTIFAVIFTIFAGVVNAGGAMGGKATEVTQIMNNLELSLMTIQDYTRNLTLAKQLYVQQMQQMRGSADPELATEIGEKARLTTQALGATQELYGSMSTLKDVMQQRVHQYSASGLDWASYVQREKDRAALDQKATTFLAGHELSSLVAVQRNYETVRRHQSTSQGSQGTHSAMMAMNGQMNTMLTLLNQGLEATAIHQHVQSQRLSLDDAERARGLAGADAHRKAQDAVNERNTQLLRGVW